MAGERARKSRSQIKDALRAWRNNVSSCGAEAPRGLKPALPDAGYGLVAEAAAAFFYVECSDGEACPLDDFAAAARAVGALGGMAGNVSDVNVVQAFGVGGGLGAL